MFKALFITALSLEYKAVRSFLTDCQEIKHSSGTVYEKGKYQHWEVSLAEVGQGDAKAAVETGKAIEFFKPDYVFFVGVAGGIKDVSLGDVVIAEEVKGYEKGKETDTGFLPRGEMGQPDYGLIERAKATIRNGDWLQKLSTEIKPNVFLGVIAAGEKVVASERCVTYERLITLYSDALAVEMEGIGFSKAIYVTNAKGIIVRGISDLLNNKSESDKSGWQPKAAYHAALFAFTMLERLLQTSIELNKSNSFQELQEILRPVAKNLTDDELKKFNSVCLQYVSQECIQNSFFETLNYLFDLGKSSKGQYPILCVINHLVKENIIISLVKYRLIEWMKNTAKNCNIELEAISYVQIKENIQNELNLLSIKLKFDKDKKNRYTPEAWLNGVNICPDNMDIDFVSEKSLQPLMNELLKEVKKLPYNPLIEFIVPKRLMYHHFENLDNQRYEENKKDPLGICFQIILRPIERVEYRQYLQDLSDYWKRIKQNEILTHDIDDTSFKRLADTEQDDITSLLDDNYVCFSLDFQLSKNHEHFLDELIRWGAISALWSCQCENLDEMQNDIREYLFGTKIINLPEKIYRFRRKFKKRCITLFWDDPDRLPPQLERGFLGKEFRQET